MRTILLRHWCCARDREVLEGWTRSSTVRAGVTKRARIVLLAADGVGTRRSAELIGVGGRNGSDTPGAWTEPRQAAVLGQ